MERAQREPYLVIEINTLRKNSPSKRGAWLSPDQGKHWVARRFE